MGDGASEMDMEMKELSVMSRAEEKRTEVRRGRYEERSRGERGEVEGEEEEDAFGEERNQHRRGGR